MESFQVQGKIARIHLLTISKEQRTDWRNELECDHHEAEIEVGAVVTEYTERKSDLVDKASLKRQESR